MKRVPDTASAGSRRQWYSGIFNSIVRKWLRQYHDGGAEALVLKRCPSNPLAGYMNKKAPSETKQLRGILQPLLSCLCIQYKTPVQYKAVQGF